MMGRPRTSFLILIIPLYLAACSKGGGFSSGLETPAFTAVDVVPVYADQGGTPQTASDVITDGGTLTAGGPATAALRINYARDAARISDGAILLRSTPDGHLAVTLEGQTQIFTAADLQTSADGLREEGYVERDDTVGRYVGLYSHSGEITDVLNDDADYAEAVSLFTSQAGHAREQRFVYAVVGTQTRPDIITSLGTVSYTGEFKLEAVPKDLKSFENERIRVRGNTTLQVTDSGHISGTLDDMRMQPAGGGDYEAMAGRVVLAQTPITPEGFAGALIAEGQLADTVLETGQDRLGDYGGTFYGPQAEQAAGTLTIETSDRAQDMIGVGFFTTEPR